MKNRSLTPATALVALACSLTIAWDPASPTTTPPATATAPASALAARLALAQSQLSPKAVTVALDDTFGLVGFPGPTLRAAADSARASLAALFHDRFVTRPTSPVIAYVFSDSAHSDRDPVTYDAFCVSRSGSACVSPYGFYEKRTHEIFATADPTFGTLTHELVHPIVEADFPKAPVWFDECLASLYEAPVLTPPDGIHGTVNWRLDRLVKALAGKDHASAAFPALFGMTDAQFEDDDADVALHYATARYTCQWLDQKEKLWPFYRAWRANAAADATGEAAFAATVGTTPADAEKGWEKWVLGLGGR